MSASLSSIGKQIIVYGGSTVFILGAIGGFLNILVFHSLKTFRQSSCAFYLTIMSIVNIGQFFFGLLSRIMLAQSGIDGTQSSLFYCKVRVYFFQVCMATSMTCLSFATIDQYCATCSYPRLQRFCNIKLSYRLVMISIIIWILHGISYFIYVNHTLTSTTNITSCTLTNYIYSQYQNIGLLVVLIGYFPVTIAALFGSMAYCNVKEIAFRTVPLVRRELDKQLTVMVLTQVVVDVFTGLPYVTINGLLTNAKIISDPSVQQKIQFAANITLVMYYAYVASPFYIYFCVSERFRRQLIYVLSRIRLTQCKQPAIATNQIIPET